ncbi:adenosylcobinamide-GDP ribazoletransferase [Ornithinimicrobium pratense]|uniref:Adenosylcobinamide-GDP ribazoletransferase n=1 Tax=Ornithinimicrobium pratense TaxID=2593973 RepID=A0A5J6V7A2_9MICO|nr:adenosylcobinamide-GDP ribazoletransferase [Ornithinimicrobium pratense]QFG69940.1 adenosylcobinamide-GDP ribazoletransferase [Ornithinimicrobium pratense]
MSVLGSFLDAVAFLTRVPVPPRRRFDLARAAWAFPVVGGLLGLLLGTLGVLAADPLGWFVAAVVVVAVEVVLTGALHLDGLADCADGTGGADRQARLRIMKDHSVGVYGVAAVVLDVLLKVALIGGLLQTTAPGVAMITMTLAWTLSRAAMLPLAAWLPYARDEGTGRSLVEGLSAGRLWAGVLVAAVCGGAATWAGTGLTGAGVWILPLALLLAAALTALLVGAWARRTLGGVTGDVLGATAEVTLLAALLVGALLLA